MKLAWNNDGFVAGHVLRHIPERPQRTSWIGQMIIDFGGIGIHGTSVGNRLDLLNIPADGWSVTRTTVNLPM